MATSERWRAEALDLARRWNEQGMRMIYDAEERRYLNEGSLMQRIQAATLIESASELRALVDGLDPPKEARGGD